jgi:hypothetical protein
VTDNQKKSVTKGLTWLGDMAKSALAIAAFLALLAGPLNDTAKWYAREVLGFREATVDLGRCLTIPKFDPSSSSTHSIEPVVIGDKGVVQWVGLVRHRADCGIPTVIGHIANGGGIIHRVPISIGEGINLEPGVHNLRYGFDTQSSVTEFSLKPGRAFFWVSVTFPDAIGGAQTVNSDEIPFVLLPRN